jgi:1-deoxyxylulose-5-phosphate synthase
VEYRLLGRTGLRVSQIALGTALLGLAPGESESETLVHHAIEAGVNLFDCANTYGSRSSFDRDGLPPAHERRHAEELLGRALGSHRDEVIVCTKVSEPVGFGINDGGYFGAPGGHGGGLSRYHILREVDRSLRRLQTDRIDILHAHHPDGDTAIEDTLRTFDDLVHQGKVRYVALSTYNGWQTAEAVLTADRYGLARPILNQTFYSLMHRGAEKEIIPAAVQFGVAVTCFSPLAGGALAGTSTLTRQYSGMRRWGVPIDYTSEQKQIATDLENLATAWGAAPAHLALRWLLGRPAVVATIVGPESASEFDELARLFDLTVDHEQMAQIDAIGRPPAPLLPFE